MQEFNKGVYDYIIATDESGEKQELDMEDVEHNGSREHDNDVKLDDGRFE